MVDERTFGCTNVLGAELCHGFGPSFGILWAGIAELAIALLIHVVLLFVTSTTSTTTTYQYVRVPLLQPATQSTGVIISAPGGSTQIPRAQAMVAAESL
jgi:hypothetical protein